MVFPFKPQRKFPSATESLEESAKQIREGLGNAPRLNLGHQPAPQHYPQQPLQPQQYPQQPPQQLPPQPQPQPVPQQPVQQPQYPQYPPMPTAPVVMQEDPLIAKIKRWLLISLTAIIAGMAIILIIWRLILKF